MEIRELGIALFLYGGNMEYIQRPKEVSKLDKRILTEKNFQENTSKELLNIYNKIDELVDAENYVPEPEPTEKVLFTGSSASPSLNDDVKNFQELDIYYRYSRESQYFYGRKTIQIVNGASKFSLLDFITLSDEDVVKGATTTYTVSAKKITVVYGKQIEFSNGGLVAMNKLNSYVITKVIGKY